MPNVAKCFEIDHSFIQFTHNYVCLSGGSEMSAFWKFWVHTKFTIPSEIFGHNPLGSNPSWHCLIQESPGLKPVGFKKLSCPQERN